MATKSKLAQLKGKGGRKRLDAPPKPEEAKGVLDAPEHAPNAPQRKARNKTGRTEPLSTRVTREFLDRLKMASVVDRKKMVEILEDAFDLYEKKQGR